MAPPPVSDGLHAAGEMVPMTFTSMLSAITAVAVAATTARAQAVILTTFIIISPFYVDLWIKREVEKVFSLRSL